MADLERSAKLRRTAEMLRLHFTAAGESSDQRIYVHFFVTPRTWDSIAALRDISARTVDEVVHATLLAFHEFAIALAAAGAADLLKDEREDCERVARSEAKATERCLLMCFLPASACEHLFAMADIERIDPGALIGAMLATLSRLSEGH